MQVQKTENNNPTFGIKISSWAYKRASHYYKEVVHDNQLFNRFYRKAKYMEQNFGHDEYELFFGNEHRSNGKYYTLYVTRYDNPNGKSVVVQSSKRFSTLIENFIHLKDNLIDAAVKKMKNGK